MGWVKIQPIPLVLCRTFAVRARNLEYFITLVIDFIGAPNGNRTRVSALRGPRPRPLDDGSRRTSARAGAHRQHIEQNGSAI